MSVLDTVSPVHRGPDPWMKRALLTFPGLLLLGCAVPGAPGAPGPSGAGAPQRVAFVSSFRYDYIDALSVETDVDGVSETADGYLFEGSFGFTEDLRLIVGQRNVDQASVGIDIEETKFGAGLHRALSDNADLVLDAFLIDGKGDDGNGLSGGLRAMLSDRIEVGASLEWTDVYGSDRTGYELTGVWYASQELGALVQFTELDDETTIGFGLRASL